MTRRIFLGLPQIIGVETQQGSNDTVIILFDGARSDTFSVGVRTKIHADWAIVRVFYRAEVVLNSPLKVLRSKESKAPVVGWSGYGATQEDFVGIPVRDIQSIEIDFVVEVAKRNFHGTGKME